MCSVEIMSHELHQSFCKEAQRNKYCFLNSLFSFYFCSQIDDKEFDIPQVDTPPTLESILNELEDEEEPFVLEDTCVLSTDNMDAHSCDTSSLASSDSGDPAHLKRKKRTVDLNATVHGSVLRHSLLKGISAQIVSAADKVDAGLPTAIVSTSLFSY
uniref:Uncharacterized protein n=1 Tax=Lates calcarifer TaxID=8187 RepID=A0A4W6C2G6_LATCA